MAYSGNSIVDYLSSVGQDSSYGARSKLAASKGIKGYTGSAEQNTQLLSTLRSGSGFNIMGSAPPNQNIDFNAIQKVASSAPSLATPVPRVPTPLPQPTIVPQLQAAGASPTQATQIAQQVQQGNVTPTGVPNNMAHIMNTGTAPTTTSTIPVSSLSTDSSKSMADLLKSSVGGTGNDATSTVAGLLNLYNATSPQEKNYNETAATLQSLQTQLGGESKDYQDALTQMGIPAAYQQIQSLNLKAAQLKGSLEAFDAETEQGKSNIEGQAIPLGLVQGQQAQFQKQRDLTRLSKAAELSATIGLSEAYKGNIDTGLDLMKQTIDLKYAPIKNQIDLAKTQLDIAGKLLDRSDSRTGKIITTLLDLQSKSVDSKIQKESDLNKLAIQAASAGAPLSLVQSALATGDSVTAASILSQYIHATGEPTGGGISGTFSKSQLNNGADNAGLGLDSFNSLPYEVKNFFVSAPAGTIDEVRSIISTIADGSDSPENINAYIDSGAYPPTVKSYLHSLVHGEGSSTSSGGGGGFSSLRSAAGTIGQGIGNAWSAITNWFTGK